MSQLQLELNFETAEEREAIAEKLPLPQGEAQPRQGSLFRDSASVFCHPQANRRIVLQISQKQHAYLGQPPVVAFLLQRRHRKTVGMQVAENGLTVNAPTWVGMAEIERILQSKAPWILRKLHEQAAKKTEKQQLQPLWQHGMFLPWQGGLLQVQLSDAFTTQPPAPNLTPAQLRQVLAGAQLQKPLQGVPQPNTWVLHLNLPVNTAAATLQQVLAAWVQQQAMHIFTQRLQHYAPMLGVSWKALRLSNAKGSWGCATSKGTIRLHWRLPQFAPEIVDYVVVHELAHLREMNHSPRFWALVEQILPDYKQRAYLLKKTPLPLW